MTETGEVRLLLHEAIDIDRLVREYCRREKLTVESVADIIGDGDDADDAAAEIVALAEDDDRDETVNVARVSELVRRIGEIYETAEARSVIHAVRQAAAAAKGRNRDRG